MERGERIEYYSWRDDAYYSYRFRIDPVPHTGKGKYYHYLFRHPKMLRCTLLEESDYPQFFRKRRSRKYEDWDDYVRHHEKCWKKQRKVRHQWQR